VSKEEKRKQLGMDPGTASHRLVKDILWSYIVKCEDNFCHHCGAELSRDDFSIEHVIPWLHSEDPVKLFFDIDNISFSHLSCNISKARRPTKKYESESERLKAKWKRRYWSKPKSVRQQKRREKYLRTGT
jgi:hypothetical protein